MQEVKKAIWDYLKSTHPRERAKRENIKISKMFNIEIKEAEIILNQLVKEGKITEKVQYMCRNCSDTMNLTKDDFKELSEGEDFIECEECQAEIYDEKIYKTGYVYYDLTN